MKKNQFVVKDYFKITNRSTFLIGHIISGELQIGMKEKITNWMISAIEFLDKNIAKHEYYICVSFVENPPMLELQKIYNLESVLDFE
jgi:hypothetical protein